MGTNDLRSREGLYEKEDLSGRQDILPRTYTIPQVVLLAGPWPAWPGISCHKGQYGQLAANLRAGAGHLAWLGHGWHPPR